MAVFKNKDEYKRWIENQSWYQTIELPSGLRTPGRFPTHLRTSFFGRVDFKDKSVLDVGCNSGQYCFMAKDMGAEKVSGFDVDAVRIAQARTLAENEGYGIEFEQRGIFDMDTSKRYDVLLCIAVLTEIQDIFGAIEVLKKVIGEKAFIELDIAKPIAYLSYSKKWLRGYGYVSRRTAVTEVRRTKRGLWVISPSLDILRAVFGSDFSLRTIKGGVRYDMVEVTRVNVR